MVRNSPAYTKDLLPSTVDKQYLGAIMRLFRTMLRHGDVHDIISAVVRELSHVIAFDRASVAYLSEGKDTLNIHHLFERGTKKAGDVNDGREVALEEMSVIGWVARNKQPMMRNDIDSDGRFREIVSGKAFKSDIVVPLIANDRLIGTLSAGSYKDNAFTDADLDIFALCGKIICDAVENGMVRKDTHEFRERAKQFEENTNDIIILMQRSSGKIMEVNRKCEQIIGFSREELMNKSYFDLFAREDHYQAKRDFIEILSRKAMSFVDRRIMSKDGRIIYVDVNAGIIQTENNTFIQLVLHDISQRKMMEQQIILQNRDLVEANKRLREVDRMKTEFLGNISHELKTPLSIILSYSESLRDREISELNRVEFVEVIMQNGQNLLALINNLIDLSRLEASGSMLRPTLSHVHDVIRSIWPEVEKTAAAKNISISFQAGSGIPVLYFDNNQVLQVVSCLINNAIKFTDDGGSVDVKTSMGDRKVWVQVVDTGTGIPQEDLETIFEPFRQVDGSASRRWGGMGIGLAIAKHVVEMHNGELWAESAMGRGSVFTFTLPVDTEESFLVDYTVRDTNE